MNSNENLRLERLNRNIGWLFAALFSLIACLAITIVGRNVFAADLPPSKGSAADFPGVVWKNRLADDELWGKGGWRRDGDNLFVAKGQAFCPFPEKLADAAIRVRFQYDGPDGSFIDLLLRSDGKATNVRYVATTFIGKEPEHKLSVDIRYKDSEGNHGSIGGAGKLASLQPGDQHTLEFYVLGDHLAYYVDGKLAASFHDPKLTAGQIGLFTGSQLHFVSVETADLSNLAKLAMAPLPPPGKVTPSPSTVAMLPTTPRPAPPASLPANPPAPPRSSPPSTPPSTLPPAIATARATPPPAAKLYEIKSLLRVNKARAYVENGWKGNVPCIQAEVRVTRELTTEKPYAHAYFFDHEGKQVLHFNGPIQASDDHINYTAMPAFFKPHQNSKFCFPITEAANQPGHHWTHVVIVFGDGTDVAAESFPREDLSKFDFPEKDLALKASETPAGSPPNK